VALFGNGDVTHENVYITIMKEEQCKTVILLIFS